MKYALLIVVSAFLFGVLGLFAGWGAVEYYTSGGSRRSGDEVPIITFIGFSIGGTMAGLVVGCIAACLGHFFTRRTSEAIPKKHLQ